MARTINSKCDFDGGYFACDIPKDANTTGSKN